MLNLFFSTEGARFGVSLVMISLGILGAGHGVSLDIITLGVNFAGEFV